MADPSGVRARALDHAGFDAALDDNRRRLYGIALAILRNPSEAEDALQDALLKAWKSWATLGDRDAAGAWLTRICVNQCIDHRRRLQIRRARPVDEGDRAPAAPLPEGLIDLDRAFAKLSRQQRAVLTLHDRFGYSIDECASLLNCSSGSIRTHIARAMDKLRKEMTQ